LTPEKFEQRISYPLAVAYCYLLSDSYKAIPTIDADLDAKADANMM